MKKILSTIGLVSGCLVLSAIHSQVQAQTRTVTGKVNNGEKPLIGVVVTQEGTRHLTTTTANGAFSLQITGENPVLIFRHPEYRERKIPTVGKSTFTITLDEKVKSIEEVVLNAGYYNVKAKESTGSISKVTAKDIENQPVTNVLSALQGRLSGVNITQNTGSAGGGFDIQIRGRNSLRTSINSLSDGNQPLYIIDGVPLSGQLTSTYSAGILPLKNISPLNAISPNDIESIEILKDADATAIYGSRGGNGVVIIRTKRGKANTVSFTLNSSLSLSKVGNYLDMMDTGQYVLMRKQAYSNVGITNLPANAYDVNGTWDQTRYTDWQKELLGKTAENSRIQLLVSGGSEKNTFAISAGYGDQSSVFPGNQHYKTHSFNSHYNHYSPNNRFTLSLSNNISFATNNTLKIDFTNKAVNLSPNAPRLYDQQGDLNWENNTFGNPLAQLNATYENKVRQINQNVEVAYKPLSNFVLKINAGLTMQELEEFSLTPYTTNNPAYPSGTSSAFSSASRATGSVMSYIAEPQASWSKRYNFGTLNILAGLTYQENRTQTSAISGNGFASNALLHNIAAATNISLQPLTDTRYRYAAFFGRFNYNLNDKYFLNITARRDGSSRFGPRNKFADFGAIGAAWVLSKEAFLKKVSWISFAKLRGSIGKTGSDAIGDFQYTNSYSLSSTAYNSLPALFPSRLYNPNFSWEKTTKLEAALEISFFKDRFNFTGAWYQNRSTSQLVGIPLPATTGFSVVQGNLAATVQNKGVEIEISSVNVNFNDWKWTSSVNLTFPTNKLLAFPGLAGSTYARSYVIGESTSVVKLFEYQGINPLTGLYQFTDFNNDGNINSPDDAKSLRTLGPRYFGGLQNTLSYREFSLSFLFQFVNQLGWNYFRTMSVPGQMVNQPIQFLNVWSETNPTGIIMPYSPGTDSITNTLTANLTNSTAAVSDASYIRLKNIQFNYRIPVNQTLIKEATVYVQGQNLLTWTKYFGLDPEFVTSGYLPPLQTFSLGVQLTF